LVSFFVRPSAFLRPDLDPAGAPRATAVKAGRRCEGAASSGVARPRLDGGEHGARLDGRDDRSRNERRDVILDWAVNEDCGKHRITLYPVGREDPYPNLSCTGESKAQKETGPI
jgi:hypothetical protein